MSMTAWLRGRHYLAKGGNDMAGFDTINPHVRMIFVTKLSFFVPETVHHKLSLTYRFLLLLRGSFRLCCNGREEQCSQGDIVFMPPKQEYETVFSIDAEVMNIFFDFYPGKLQSDKGLEPITNFFIMTGYETLDPTKYSERIFFDDMPEFNELFVIHKLPDAEDKCRELYHLYTNTTRHSRLRLNAKLTEFIIDVADYFAVQKQNPSRSAAKTIINYINAHYNERLNCRSVAEHFSYHPNYVNRIVRELTGITLHDYITGVKIQHANQLLLETDMTITDIAYYLSFHDSSHFSSVYFAHTGMKPSERRKLARENREAGGESDPDSEPGGK